eukprot:5663918-Prymnesium_polylepis.1
MLDLTPSLQYTVIAALSPMVTSAETAAHTVHARKTRCADEIRAASTSNAQQKTLAARNPDKFMVAADAT